MARANFIGFKGCAAVSQKLDNLVKACPGKTKSEVLRALVLVARAEDLPRAWTEVDESERTLIELAEGGEA